MNRNAPKASRSAVYHGIPGWPVQPAPPCAAVRLTRWRRYDEILHLVDIRAHPERQFPLHLSKTLEVETVKSVHFV